MTTWTTHDDTGAQIGPVLHSEAAARIALDKLGAFDVEAWSVADEAEAEELTTWRERWEARSLIEKHGAGTAAYISATKSWA